MQAVEDGDVSGVAPELVWLEVANALATSVRAGTVPPPLARRTLIALPRLPLEGPPLRELASPALAVAVARGLTAYDAAYVALAEAEDAVLVTADRELARVYKRVELIT